MTDQLRHLLHDEIDRLDVPPPPVDAILVGGRRRRLAQRRRTALAVVASVVVVAGTIAGVARLVADDGDGRSLDPAGDATSASTGGSDPASGRLAVSGAGVGTQAFGADADEVVAAVTDRLGSPDVTVGPTRYARIPGDDRWYEDAGDPISPSWAYPVLSVSCWHDLCLLFGGEQADALVLRGWELAETGRWAASGVVPRGAERSDVRLAGSGIRLGDSWEELHAAYPGTVVGGGEGASLVVDEAPWEGIFDGVGAWRLSGEWDYTHPTRAPEGAVVTRLSGGEGPEPGCC